MLAAGVALLGAACGSTAAPGPAAAKAAAPSTLSLAGSVATQQATWAVLPMGAQSGPNEFWQLFLQVGGTHSWRLDTPPDIATNGAPALAGLSGTGLVEGVRPSLKLTFSPLSQTSNGGKTWTAGPPSAALAGVPDALAGTAAGSQLLTLSTSGKVSTGSAAGGTWRTLTTEASLASSAAGRACGLTGLTAVAFAAPATPLVAGACSRPGTVGIFAKSSSGFTSAGPALPAAYAHAQVRVLRLMAAGSQTVTILQAGTGSAAVVLAAWRDAAGKWTLSAGRALGGATVRSSSFGAAGNAGVLLSTGKGAIIAGPGSGWQELPAVPRGHAATLALPAGGQPEVLTATGGIMTVWQLSADGAAWTNAQKVKVPIQYGSSE